MGVGVVVEFGDKRVAFENGLHEAALDAAAAAVDEAQRAQPGRVRGVHIFINDRRHVPGPERVQHVGQRELDPPGRVRTQQPRRRREGRC